MLPLSVGLKVNCGRLRPEVEAVDGAGGKLPTFFPFDSNWMDLRLARRFELLKLNRLEKYPLFKNKTQESVGKNVYPLVYVLTRADLITYAAQS